MTLQVLPFHPDSKPKSACTALQLEDLWDRHGTSVYTLACALLGDETAAAQAVTLGMTDLAGSAGSASTNDARRCWARHVYWRSKECETSNTPRLPPAMVWLGQLTHLQRACLALCLFGGHTRREAADLLDVPPTTAADLLTSGLREVKRLAAGGTAANA
ncbi:MAG: hypothetical protein ABIO48_07625 [Pedococcus sp.]